MMCSADSTKRWVMKPCSPMMPRSVYRSRTLPLDKINFDFVTGNKTMVGSVNSTGDDFRAAIADLQKIETRWPGLAARLITHRLTSLNEAVRTGSESTRGAIKAIVALGLHASRRPYGMLRCGLRTG